MILFVFVDGVGVGPRGAPNPFTDAPIEVLAPLAGRPPPKGVFYTPLDASLGWPGLPQSATGQAALFTGEDAMAVAGGHWAGAPTPRLARFIADKSVFARARAEGLRTAMLNAYDERRARHVERVVRGEERASRRYPPSAIAWGALASADPHAPIELRTLGDVRAGRAATFDVTGEVVRGFGIDAPVVTPTQAADALLAGAREVDLAVFEAFLTDKAGHAQDTTWARHEIARHERLLAALVGRADPSRDLVVVTSDHGNLEDLSTRGHTRAPVPLLAFGLGAEVFVSGARDLRDVALRLLERARTRT